MNTMQSLQIQWDQEHRTIEAGKRAFFPDRPVGEPGQLVGFLVTSAVFLLLAAVWSLLP